MKYISEADFFSPTTLFSIVLYAKLADTQDQLIQRLLVTVIIAEGARHSHARTLRHYRARGVYIGGEMTKEPLKMTRRTTRWCRGHSTIAIGCHLRWSFWANRE
jgi:hypothetical protein